MRAEQFILAATEMPMPCAGGRDSTQFRGGLVGRFARIHEGVRCEHSLGESYLIADAILRLEQPGPVIECGCFQGGMSAKLSIVCAAVGRALYVCDSFDGLPTPAGSGTYRHFANRKDVIEAFGETCRFERGQYEASLQAVRQNIRYYGHIEACNFVPGLFQDSLPNLDVFPALVTIDVDLIESARACLQYLWPRLQGKYFFTHEAFIQTYMNGIADEQWWSTTMRQQVPEIRGSETGLNHFASCTAVLIKADRD